MLYGRPLCRTNKKTEFAPVLSHVSRLERLPGKIYYNPLMRHFKPRPRHEVSAWIFLFIFLVLGGRGTHPHGDLSWLQAVTALACLAFGIYLFTNRPLGEKLFCPLVILVGLVAVGMIALIVIATTLIRW